MLTEHEDMTDDDIALREEIDSLAGQLFGGDGKKRAEFVNRLRHTLALAQNKEFLLIHSPGGWGSTRLENCLDWERSVVAGVTDTMGKLGRTWALVQYFRSGRTFWHHMLDVKKEARFFLTGKSVEAERMAAELTFITQHLRDLRIILVGASQGAAFGNAVMRHLTDGERVFSIELGQFFPQMKRRVITARTLAIDSNGSMPDPMCNRNLWAGFKAYVTAPYQWTRFRLQGKPQKFTYCINAPGHDYSWEYPEVRRQIESFLSANFGTHQEKVEGGQA